MKYFFVRSILSFALALPVIFSSCTQEKPEKKPNIIFLFADDQSYHTVHATGNDEIITPNLDRLSEEGVTFTHAYNMGGWNGAVCLASRAMINTGRFVWRAHAVDANQQELADRGEMWSQLMQKAGYDTYMSGKWHVVTDANKVFDHVADLRPGGMPGDVRNNPELRKKFREYEKNRDGNSAGTAPIGYNRPQSPGDTAWQPWDKKFGGYWEGGKHWTEVLADDALAFIDSAKKQDKPFFMYLAFNAPHDPRQSPKEFVDMYPLDNIELPASFMPEYPYKDSIGCGPQLRDEALAPFPRTEYSVKVHRQEYYAIISHLDQQIGRILKALEESGEMDNTYIFYTADHGLSVGNHGLIGKQNLYDHSVRVPLIVVGPEVPKNVKKEVDVYLQDVMASALELSGTEKPEYVEFNSLMPFVRREQTESNYPAIYGCYMPDMQRMIRKDGYKLIVYPHGKTVLLFDLDNDPEELINLAENPDYQQKKRELFEQLLILQREMDDPLDLKEVFTEI